MFHGGKASNRTTSTRSWRSPTSTVVSSAAPALRRKTSPASSFSRPSRRRRNDNRPRGGPRQLSRERRPWSAYWPVWATPSSISGPTATHPPITPTSPAGWAAVAQGKADRGLLSSAGRASACPSPPKIPGCAAVVWSDKTAAPPPSTTAPTCCAWAHDSHSALLPSMEFGCRRLSAKAATSVG